MTAPDDQLSKTLQADSPAGPATPCPICGGTGFVRVNVPPDHPLFGRAIACRCKRAELRRRREEQLRSESNLKHLTIMTFDTFETDEYSSPEVSLGLSDAKRIAQAFAAEPQGWLLITGDYGCGKTHLAAAIGNYRTGLGEEPLFVVVPDLLDHLRSTFSPNSRTTYDRVFDEVRTTPLLLLDDLGTQSATPWAREKLYQIFNYRYNARLPLVITTAASLEEIDPRIRSRMLDSRLCTIHAILAPSYRPAPAAPRKPRPTRSRD